MVVKKTLKLVLILFGFISLILGIIGIFLPLLPTTPFVLLSAYLFSKSSERYHNWLIHNKIFGKYIEDYQNGKGVPKKVKTISIIFLWISILSSAIFFVKNIIIKIILIIIAFAVSFHINRIKTKK